MAYHARMSASQTKRWWSCPGSQALIEAMEKESESGTYAMQGTVAHFVAETCIGEGSQPDKYLGHWYYIDSETDDAMHFGPPDEGEQAAKMESENPDVKAVFECDLDMVEAVTVMTDYVRRRCVELKLCPNHGKPETLARAVRDLVKKGKVQLENRVNALPHRDDTSGTADVIIDAWPECLEVVDYKHGSGVHVPVESNHQLRSYTLGAKNESGVEHDLYRYTIVQPRHKNGGVESEEISAPQINAWGQELDTAAMYVDQARELVANHETIDDLFEKGMITVGDDGSHCTFCDLKMSCPALRKQAERLAQIDFDDDAVDIHLDAKAAENIAKILPWVPMFDKFFSEIKAAAEKKLLTGGKIPGFKLVRGRSNRRWKTGLSEDDIAFELELMGIDAADVFKRSLLTAPQAEKLVPKDHRSKFNELFVEKPEGKLTVAPESDKKPAVEVDPGADFE